MMGQANISDLNSKMQGPIFVGGLFKSGTTLLRAMLGQHSNIASGLETYWFDLNWEERHSPVFLEKIEKIRQFYNLDEELTNNFVGESKSNAEFLSRFLSHYAETVGKKRWLEKTPGNVLHLENIFSVWQGARFIHIVRDPRDVFASFKESKKRDTVEVMAELWTQYFGAVQWAKRHMKLAPEQFMEIRYERLVLYPVETIKRVLDFLNEPWETEVAGFNGKSDEYGKVLELTGKASTTLKRLQEPLSRQRLGLWKMVVSKEEIEHIHHLVRDQDLLWLMEEIEQETNSILD